MPHNFVFVCDARSARCVFLPSILFGRTSFAAALAICTFRDPFKESTNCPEFLNALVINARNLYFLENDYQRDPLLREKVM